MAVGVWNEINVARRHSRRLIAAVGESIRVFFPENVGMTSRCLWGLLVLVSALSDHGVAQDVYRLPNGPLPIAPPAAAQQLNEFDRTMIREMQDRGAVGAAVAVTRFGRLVYTRGFGYADLETSEPVQPTSLFRIGSMSKPITAVAVLQLVCNGSP